MFLVCSGILKCMFVLNIMKTLTLFAMQSDLNDLLLKSNLLLPIFVNSDFN